MHLFIGLEVECILYRVNLTFRLLSLQFLYFLLLSAEIPEVLKCQLSIDPTSHWCHKPNQKGFASLEIKSCHFSSKEFIFLNTPKGLLTFKTKLGKIHVSQTQKLTGSIEVKQQDVRQSDVPWCCSLKTQQVVDIYHSYPLHKYKLEVQFGSTQRVKRQKAVNLLFIQEH